MRRRPLAALLAGALLAACSTSTGDDAAPATNATDATDATEATAATTAGDTGRTEPGDDTTVVPSGTAGTGGTAGTTGTTGTSDTAADGSASGPSASTGRADTTAASATTGDSGEAPGAGASSVVGTAGSGSSDVAPAGSPASSTSTTVAATTTTLDPNAPPVVEAAAYTVYDMRRGQYLAQSNADAPLAVGSLMKLLAAQAAYAAGQPVKLARAPDSGLVLADEESNIGIRPGQELSRDLLIRAMLKVSANDAARLLALDIAGSEAAFAEQMNAWAANLGLTNTHAVNATGLDAEGQYSTANDMTRLAVFLMGNISFQQAVKDPTSQLNGVDFANTNTLLGVYPGADGIKTGHTTQAGWCIVASATRDGHRVVATVLGAPTEEARDAAATALLDWAFARS